MGVGLLSLLVSSLVVVVGRGVMGSVFSVVERACNARGARLAGDVGDVGDAGDVGSGGSASKSCPS